MALTTTTASSAVSLTDNTIVVASATGFAAGNLVLIDQELMKVSSAYVSGTTIPVLRGQDGTVTAAHKASANVNTFLASDEAGAVAQTTVQFPVAGKARTVASYSAAGAIALPAPGSDAVALINGTGALAMTLVNPTKDMDGSILWIVANGKAAHTVTWSTASSGIGNGGANVDLATFAAGGQNTLLLIAANGFWCAPPVLAGTLTNITVTMS